MARGVVRLCYQKVIDNSSQGVWERNIFDATHKEFYMQAQQFDQSGMWPTFSEILKNVPKADRMHYLVSTAAVGYLHDLNEIIPDIRNFYGNLCLPFRNFRFEIIQSHVSERRLHKVAIYFYSEPLTWIDSFGEQFIFATGNQLELLLNGHSVDTDSLTLNPSLTIASFQERIPLINLENETRVRDAFRN